MKKNKTLLKAGGLSGLFKASLYALLRKLNKKISSFSTELYDLQNFIERRKGKIAIHGKTLFVDFNLDGHAFRFQLRKGSSDATVLTQIFQKLEYQPLVTLINCFPQTPISNIVDAGANAGFTSVFLGKNFPEARIISIEPDAENFLLLNTNIKENGINCSARAQALWGTSEKVKISPEFRDHREWSRQVQPMLSSDKSYSIEGITLDTILREEKWKEIDILKMDIEGGEKNVFSDKALSLDILSRIKFIAIELHDEFDFRMKFESYLKEAGFIYTNTGESLIGFNAKKVGLKNGFDK